MVCFGHKNVACSAIRRRVLTTWPNWVDLVILIIVLRTCYSGFGRGVLGELLTVLGVVTATALASNFYGMITQRIAPWWAGDQAILACMIFWALLGGAIVLFHAGIHRFLELLKWERLHWTMQSLGLLLGAVRGLWWSGLVVLVLGSLGSEYFTDSVHKRSVIGSRFAPIASQQMKRVVDRYPGSAGRGELVPAITVRLPKFPDDPLAP